MYSLYFMWGCHCFYALSVDSIKKYMHIYVHLMYIYMHTYYVNTSPHSSLFLCLCMYMSQTHIYVYITVLNILNYLFSFAYLLNVISPPTTMAISSTISAPPCHSLFP